MEVELNAAVVDGHLSAFSRVARVADTLEDRGADRFKRDGSEEKKLKVLHLIDKVAVGEPAPHEHASLSIPEEVGGGGVE